MLTWKDQSGGSGAILTWVSKKGGVEAKESEVQYRLVPRLVGMNHPVPGTEACRGVQ